MHKMTETLVQRIQAYLDGLDHGDLVSLTEMAQAIQGKPQEILRAAGDDERLMRYSLPVRPQVLVGEHGGCVVEGWGE